MTILFQGNRQIQAGINESPVLAVPQNIKQPGEAFQLVISMVWDDFPPGTTAIDVFLSFDGGVTFPASAGGTWDMPHFFKGPAPHLAQLGFSLGPNDNPTHAKYRTNTPAKFNTQVTIEGNSVGALVAP